VDFNGNVFLLNNIFTASARGRTPQFLRLARTGDSRKDIIAINLNFIGLKKPYFYVPASPEEIINDDDFSWYFDQNDTLVKMYAPNIKT